eukprot:1960893-Prymnesium_polylepis.1
MHGLPLGASAEAAPPAHVLGEREALGDEGLEWPSLVVDVKRGERVVRRQLRAVGRRRGAMDEG